MAKLFYDLKEAAQKLGVTVEKVEQLAKDGKLQQYRDGNTIKFKREQVDGLAGSVNGDEDDNLDDTDQTIAIADPDDTDAIDLMEDSNDDTAGPTRKEDPRAATGISVFDADEIETADPSAQTQVSQSAIDDEELVLESVGSGSGLLDLTRESDDTSLGAELLDEIYPSGEGSDAKLDSGAMPASSGAFESALEMEPSTSGLENMQAASSSGTAAAIEAPEPAAPYTALPEAFDSTFSGFSAGMLAGALACLMIGLFVGISAVTDAPSQLTNALTSSSSSLFMFLGGGIVGCVILGVVGLFLGKIGSR